MFYAVRLGVVDEEDVVGRGYSGREVVTRVRLEGKSRKRVVGEICLR